ncbi:hypothetical protein DPMN_083741 [Dreissena polymorpha]|uniref:Uncharacterized protein n=1 Tax=Dreissena polymorpha TaxID=45954 RepID=A0A9D4BBE3_DREPO|nr:hypothetical protein DPMN_083741 [Dreissena polymorpha]
MSDSVQVPVVSRVVPVPAPEKPKKKIPVEIWSHLQHHIRVSGRELTLVSLQIGVRMTSSKTLHSSCPRPLKRGVLHLFLFRSSSGFKSYQRFQILET